MKNFSQEQRAYRNGQQVRTSPISSYAPEMRSTDGSEWADQFYGHPIIFNQRTYIGAPPWGFFEEIAPEAVVNALGRPDDVRMVINHEPSLLLGRTTSGTLSLRTDAIGLATRCDLPNTTYARDLSVLVARRDLSQMSFAFNPDEEDEQEIQITDPDTGTQLSALLVTVRDMHLFDVSPVTYPAYKSTDANVRDVSYRQSEESVARALARYDTMSKSARAALQEVELLDLYVQGGMKTL